MHSQIGRAFLMLIIARLTIIKTAIVIWILEAKIQLMMTTKRNFLAINHLNRHNKNNRNNNSCSNPSNLRNSNNKNKSKIRRRD